jgi:hypothetical protein
MMDVESGMQTQYKQKRSIKKTFAVSSHSPYAYSLFCLILFVKWDKRAKQRVTQD